MQDPYPLFSIFAFLGFFVALIPLPWHFQAWNAGTCTFMLWTSVASLIEFVDSVVWRDTVSNVAPIWCDITTKLLIGAGVGIPAASLCIQRRLFKIASIQTVTITRQDKRRAVLIDMSIGIGIPVLVMILHIVVQGHRFNIVEGVGCIPTIYNTPPAYPLVFMWPPLLGCVSFVYASLTLRSFWRRRIEFNSLLSSSSASLTSSRYLRLMLLSCVEMATNVPLGVYSIYINVGGIPIARWTNWADVHYDFGFVQQFPAFVWKKNHQFLVAIEMGRWIYPCSAIVFFALFGFADEARKNYHVAFWWVASKFGFQPPPTKGLGTVGFCAPPPPKFKFSSSSTSSTSSIPTPIVVQKLSTIDVKSDHSDKTLPSYFSPSKSTSSFSSLTTPTLTTSLAKDDPRVNIGDCEKDVTSEPITVSLHDSPPCEEDGISFSDSHQSLPQFPAPYTSRFIEGPMSSPSFDRSHQSLHRTSMSDTFDNNEEGGTRVRISVSGPSLASRPSTPPSNRYHHEIPPSPPSPMSRMDTIRHDVRRGEDMV